MIVNAFVCTKYSALFGAIWVTGRIIYGLGYATGGPEGRKLGALLSALGNFPLIIMTGWNGLKMMEYV